MRKMITACLLGSAILFATASAIAPGPGSTSFRSAVLPQSVTVAFDDSASDRLRLTNMFYEISFAKTNGGILEIIDLERKQNLTLGSRAGCLWGSVFTGNQFVGGCSYSAAGTSRFTYSWDSAGATLTLNYQWDPGDARQLDAIVTVSQSESEDFDIRLTLHNRYSTLKSILFPSDLLFADQDVQSGYATYALPGVRFNQSFFQQNKSITKPYPGAEAFADFLGLDVAGSQIAFYSI